MIEAFIDADSAVVHVVSGTLDVTYEVKPGVIVSPKLKLTRNGYVLDLKGIDRTGHSASYIFGSTNFDVTVRRALSKARHLERVWRTTS